MLIVAVMLGLAVPFGLGLASEEQIRTATRRVEAFAKMARRAALDERRAYAMVFWEDGVIEIAPYEEFLAGEGNGADAWLAGSGGVGTFKDRERALAEQAGIEPAEDAPIEKTVRETYELPGDVTVNRWFAGIDGWVEARGRPWGFQPTGLCEPFKISFQREDSWITLTFNPMTASVEDEELHLR